MMASSLIKFILIFFIETREQFSLQELWNGLNHTERKLEKLPSALSQFHTSKADSPREIIKKLTIFYLSMKTF